MNNDISMIALLAAGSLAPFLVAVGTCYLKFAVVFTLLRNGLGLQQVPSNMVINAIALMLSMYVMHPVVESGYAAFVDQQVNLGDRQSIVAFLETGLGDYRTYLARYADADLVAFFERTSTDAPALAAEVSDPSMFSLLPAYALSELKDAFRIGFYLYLPFVVVDLIVSSVLLALGMMMMSPVTISAPIKLIIFVLLDGWTLVSTGLVKPYLDAAGA